jgi:hypothetical protein
MPNTQRSMNISQLLPWFEVAADRLYEALVGTLGAEGARNAMNVLRVRAGYGDDTTLDFVHQENCNDTEKRTKEDARCVLAEDDKEVAPFFGTIPHNMHGN